MRLRTARSPAFRDFQFDFSSNQCHRRDRRERGGEAQRAFAGSAGSAVKHRLDAGDGNLRLV